MNWNFLEGNWVLCPPQPTAIIHFLGGAFVATAPHLTYQKYLNALAQKGYCIIAPPFLVQPNHQAIATEIGQSFQHTIRQLQRTQQISAALPIFGLGHSLGSKLQLLLTCADIVPRAGNILISFNNASSDRAIPLGNMLTSVLPLAFYPSPEDTINLVKTQYHQAHTLVIRFQTDTLDDSDQLTPILREKFPDTLMNQILAGDHLTPLGQGGDRLLENQAFNEPITPFNQWIETEFFAKLKRLEQITIKWLDYQQQLYRRSQNI